MVEPQSIEGEIDLNSTSGHWTALAPSSKGWNVARYTGLSTQLRYINAPATPTTWRVAVEYSIDGATWHELFVLSDGVQEYFLESISGYQFIRARTTVAQGAAARATLTMFAYRDIN